MRRRLLLRGNPHLVFGTTSPLTTCSESALASAMSVSGNATFETSYTPLTLTTPITIPSTLTINVSVAAGFTVYISGGGTSQIFIVNGGHLNVTGILFEFGHAGNGTIGANGASAGTARTGHRESTDPRASRDSRITTWAR
jgi:hypothetical protein